MAGRKRRRGSRGGVIGGVELKYHDLTSKHVVTTNELGIGVATTKPLLWNQGTAGGVRSMNLIANGGSVSQKIGQKIMLKSLDLRWVFTQPFLASAETSISGVANVLKESSNTVKFLLVLDHQANGVTPTLADLFLEPQNTPNLIGQQNVPFSISYRKTESTKRFTILWKKDFKLPERDMDLAFNSDDVKFHGAYFEKMSKSMAKHKTMNNTMIEFAPAVTATAPVITDLCCNNVVLFVYLENGKNGGQAVHIDLNARMRFVG